MKGEKFQPSSISHKNINFYKIDTTCLKYEGVVPEVQNMCMLLNIDKTYFLATEVSLCSDTI